MPALNGRACVTPLVPFVCTPLIVDKESKAGVVGDEEGTAKETRATVPSPASAIKAPTCAGPSVRRSVHGMEIADHV